MLLTIAFVLVVLWALGFLAFHVTSSLIHLLLVIAIIVMSSFGASIPRPTRSTT